MSLLEVDGLSIRFGGVTAVDNLSFEIPAGRIFSIIGPNGAGKTTLFNIISGIYRSDQGRIRFDGQDVTGNEPHRLARAGLSRTFQNLQVFFRLTVLAPILVDQILAAINVLKQDGTTIFLVEQNAFAALSIADRGYVLEIGCIVLEGSGRQLLANEKVQAAYLGV